jgi:hypothetical protein
MNMIMQTYSGEMIDLENPKMHQIKILDIAHSLSNLCRFSGATLDFYSVAEHSILGSDEYVLMSICKDEDEANKRKQEAFAFLLHDGAEAYMTDLPRPIKQYHPSFSAIEQRLQDMIFECFGVAEDVNLQAIKDMDNSMIAMEKERCYIHDREWTEKLPDPANVKPAFWTPDQAKDLFLKRFKELSNGI